ncbi:MAG TPA: hypothetical protein VFU22_16735, partial [Roseiflexaceae bacterium]|nr:hypothetical protein [Roseiflexaceae bacterium]
MSSILLDRPRLYQAIAPYHEGGLFQTRVLLVLGMVGSGKTVVSRRYLQQQPWRSVAIELHPRTGYGWPVIQDALGR